MINISANQAQLNHSKLKKQTETLWQPKHGKINLVIYPRPWSEIQISQSTKKKQIQKKQKFIFTFMKRFKSLNQRPKNKYKYIYIYMYNLS